jgi:Putative lumazine-binding
MTAARMARRLAMRHLGPGESAWFTKEPRVVALFRTEIFMDQIQNIASAINGYFDLMYEADDNRSAEVFHDACLVHGMRDGKLIAWSASGFRDVMRNRPSPAAMKSPRDQEILGIELTVPDIAAAKVRVRIGQTGFVDHLIFHRIDGKWLITAKAFHIAQVFPAGS